MTVNTKDIVDVFYNTVTAHSATLEITVADYWAIIRKPTFESTGNLIYIRLNLY